MPGISNELISISVAEHGAELKSLKRLKDGREYMWKADPEFWGRTSPVLFPFVGAVKNKEYRTKGRTYSMGQHGFARDMDFREISCTNDEIWFELVSTDETLEKYPYEFELKIGYRLIGNSVHVMWNVKNTGSEDMPFSIGGHPAFNCPVNENEDRDSYFLKFDADKLISRDLEGGLASANHFTELNLNRGFLPISVELFAKDALILEKGQAHEVSLCTADKQPYLTVKFDAEIFGVWSPVGKKAGFVCIEPWYGRCDREDFNGELKDREWGNILKPGQEFKTEYTIEAVMDKN